MREINLPPFYVGQKVVALTTDIFFRRAIKDRVYTVLGLQATCCGWNIDIGAKVTQLKLQCGTCNKIIGDTNGIGWLHVKHFAPITENFQSISLEKVLEEETKLISVN